ncbi:scaffold attachment factor B1-like [Discoglossus pictus]
MKIREDRKRLNGPILLCTEVRRRRPDVTVSKWPLGLCPPFCFRPVSLVDILFFCVPFFSHDGSTKVVEVSKQRVIDLKAELKRSNLDTGGKKRALMEKLRKAIEDEGGNPDEIQITSDTPSKKTPTRISRGRKMEEEGAEDNGLEDDSGDNQENEENSLEQENERVLDILGETCKSEPLKEDAPEVEEIDNLEESCGDLDKSKEDDVFVTVESANSTLNVVDESNQVYVTEESKPLDPENKESKEQSTPDILDFDMVEIDKTSDQSSKAPNILEIDDKSSCDKDGNEEPKKTEEEHTDEETSTLKLSSANEDDETKMSSVEEETDKSITKDDGGQVDVHSGRDLCVSGLSSTTRATDLKNLFSKYGKVVGAKVVTNARSHGARCYGFVTMSSSEDATKCIVHLHRTELRGRMISVEKAKNEPTGKKPSDKKEHEQKTEKTSSNDRRHSTDNKSRKSSISKKDDGSNKDEENKEDKDKDDSRVATSDRSRSTKSGSRGTKRAGVRDKSKEEPGISVKTSSDSKERTSKFQEYKSKNKEEREILSFDKFIEQRERDRKRQRERGVREMERPRERGRSARERDLMIRERERLHRERARLEFERERLEIDRMERERLEIERMYIEDERRREQDRIQREREELRRQQDQLRYEQQDRRQGARRPYDLDSRRDDAYWPESKRMALDDRYRDLGRLDRLHDFDHRDRGRYPDHSLHMDRRENSRSDFGNSDVNCPDRNGRDGWPGYAKQDDLVPQGRFSSFPQGDSAQYM